MEINLSRRRSPVGAASLFFQKRFDQGVNGPRPVSLSGLSEEEFVEALRGDGASEHMIQVELEGFRALKTARDKQTVATAEQIRQRRRAREVVDEGLEPFVAAAARRVSRRSEDET